jgi:antitoxin component YwqK of YwqJK toxin-antitoxin module
LFAGRISIHYKKFSDVPFTGKTTGYMQGSFKNGKKDGKKVASVSYHDNGQLWEKPSYQDGKLDGLWVSYHDNGQLLFKGIYKDGELGPWTSFHADGTIRSCGNGVVWESCPGTYKNGVKVE